MAYQFPIGRVTGIGATPVKVLDGFLAPCGTSVVLYNSGGQTLFLGHSGVSSADGYPLNTGASLSLDLVANEPTDLYAMATNFTGGLAYIIGRAVNV